MHMCMWYVPCAWVCAHVCGLSGHTSCPPPLHGRSRSPRISEGPVLRPTPFTLARRPGAALPCRQAPSSLLEPGFQTGPRDGSWPVSPSCAVPFPHGVPAARGVLPACTLRRVHLAAFPGGSLGPTPLVQRSAFRPAGSVPALTRARSAASVPVGLGLTWRVSRCPFLASLAVTRSFVRVNFTGQVCGFCWGP